MTAEETLAAVNSRFIGESEFRDIEMTIGAGRLSRRLRLRSLRVTDNHGHRSRTLVCLMEPRPLRNINYVMTEHRGSATELTIDLFLPYGRGSHRRLAPERRREGALGSDFAYDDLRTWLYEEGHEYTAQVSNHGLVHLRGQCVDPRLTSIVRSSRAPFRLTIDPAQAFVRRVDYHGRDASIVRSHVIHSTTEIQGVTIPTAMEMIDHARDHTTLIELKRARVALDVDEGIFEPPRRHETATHLGSL